ncbi:MAG: glycerophosphodiester phosphodiesterase [Verrucomicrobia bacterium]|nr:glycerophosphodiester phosphodiesterase [Verrucomicrobiota bacterium]MBU1736320.1 glycerophosphodiester phosphodiesterase [Verrucomicrobiota bacterium]MBU1857736.1 glycerophosphodiester phosphodiesterase [Verrucomicrobiota bacterium]
MESASTPFIVAHRGASHDAPENTMAAFELAWQHKADAIETDIWMTLDGKLACIHDRTTARTADKKLDVTASSFAQLRQVDAGLWKGKKWKGERIPSLPEVLGAVPKGRKLFVEVKEGPRSVPALINVIQDSSLSNDQVVVISFSKEVVAAAKDIRPSMKVFLLVELRHDVNSGSWQASQDSLMKTMREIKADGLSASASACVNQDFVKAVHNAGFEFHVWTIDDENLAARYCSIGVDSITTNRPKAMREFIFKDTPN